MSDEAKRIYFPVYCVNCSKPASYVTVVSTYRGKPFSDYEFPEGWLLMFFNRTRKGIVLKLACSRPCVVANHFRYSSLDKKARNTNRDFFRR